MEQNHKEKEEFNLWLTVRLQEQLYAIDCRYVDSIFEITQNITALPKADDSILGLIHVRGTMLPVLDLRKLFQMKTVQEEMAEFQDMISLMKKDHIDWVNTLKRCVDTQEEFTLATDPHCCKFGRWYDQYKPTSQVVQHYFGQINEPHIRLHQSALHCFAATDEAEKQRIIKEEAEKAMEQVLKSLDDAVDAYQKSYHKMCVTISDGVSQIGILVDEIVSTEELNHIQELNFSSRESYVHTVAQTPKESNLLVVDAAHILLLSEIKNIENGIEFD
ncbi:MAG: chemotaxis protein CheW [Faecalimonas sp.]|nr:chemotaxis protein CheW [Faecalimonas sp.]